MSADDGTFEVAYATTRLAIVRAADRETAKRRFAAYVLYDDSSAICSDIVVANGESAELTPSLGPAPVDGPRSRLRAWLERHDSQTEAFETGLFEDRERALGNYLRLLAANDPWRLEGHGSAGRTLSGVALHATLETFDGRIAYRFDATQYFDYLRLDVVETLDLANVRESVRVSALVDVSALRDRSLQQIASSYDTIANEFRLTALLASQTAPEHPYDVTIDAVDWGAYVKHRREEPQRFAPPPGWTRP